MNLIFNDGGRGLAGRKGTAGDCCARSVSIVTGRDYATVWAELAELHHAQGLGRTADRGIFCNPALHHYLAGLGMVWTSCMRIGTGCRVHMRANELPAGRLMLRLSRHYTAVIDHKIHDTADPSRAGTRCVYGFWTLVKNT